MLTLSPRGVRERRPFAATICSAVADWERVVVAAGVEGAVKGGPRFGGSARYSILTLSSAPTHPRWFERVLFNYAFPNLVSGSHRHSCPLLVSTE